jgi:hypothetical protein
MLSGGARDVLETLELSGLIPDLARTWFACLVVALAILALDKYRGTPTSLLDTASEWVRVAGTVSIATVVSEAQSRHLISSGLKDFIFVMLLALWVAPRMAASPARPATEAAPERGKEAADAWWRRNM